jgi:hypothetical protein
VSIALVIQYANHMRRIILSSVTCPVVQHYSTYLMNGAIFENIYITENVCVDFLCEICLNISHSEKHWARYDIGLHVKYQLFLSDFN